MKMKALVVFRSKLFSPFKKILLLFAFKLKRPVSIRGLRLRRHGKKPRKAPPKNRVFNSLLSVFRPLKKSRKMERVSELKSFSEPEHETVLFPSPLTPAYIKTSLAKKMQTFGDEDVEDACRSFENYLVDMMVEEGKVRDLTDVEELLYCWTNLKCPVFIDLVCRFYGELCKDLFSPDDDNTYIDSPK